MYITSMYLVYRRKIGWGSLMLLPLGLTTLYAYISSETTTFLESSFLGWFTLTGLLGIIVAPWIIKFITPNKLQKQARWYSRLFSLDEYTQYPLLQYIHLGSITFLVFALKSPSLSIVTPLQIGTYICPTWFQQCYQWYLFSPSMYKTWTIILMILLAGSLVLLIHRRYVLSHLLLAIPAIWHVILVGLLTHSDYYYGHVMFYLAMINFVFLLLPNKIMTLGWFLLLTYPLSLGSKMTDSWLGGEVFKILDLGLPIIGDRLHALAAWSVLFVEGVMVWLLLASQKKIRFLAVVALFGFHFYSIAMIQYFFPAVAILILIIVFVGHERPLQWPKKTTHRLIVIGITAVLICGQSISLFIPGDSRLTGEGKRYGLHMFQSIPDCFITTMVADSNSYTTEKHWNEKRQGYCEPYYHWYLLSQQCHHHQWQSAVFTIDLAINQEPYRRIVNQINACNTQYHPLLHNDWIGYDRNTLPIIEYTRDLSQNIL